MSYKDEYIDVECSFCSTPFRARQASLLSGMTRSCGCLQKRWVLSGKANLRHGHSIKKDSPTYTSWTAMWNRCTNKKQENYLRYGGRGILIHPEWGLFDNFLRDMGIRPPNMTLDRINNNEGYELNNCRWATMIQQRHNRRVTNV